jgi:hypothetical protein
MKNTDRNLITPTPDLSKSAHSVNGDELSQPAADSLDPFDLESLRISPEYLKTGGTKKLLTNVPVRKPNKQDFVRVHPDEKYRFSPVALIELQEDREVYLVTSEYFPYLEEGLQSLYTLYLTVNRQKVWVSGQ